MLNSRMTEALNQHLNKELFSAYLYQSMQAWCTAEGYQGFANWFSVQFQEESLHAQKFYQYILNQGARVNLLAIDRPMIDFDSPLDLFLKTQDHERYITEQIHQLVALSREEKDYATEIVLQWFVTEQIEEEASVADVISKLKLMGKDGNSLYLLDKELGARVFTPPAKAAG